MRKQPCTVPAPPLPPAAANWMLEVTSPDAEQATGLNFAQLFQHSELNE